MKNKRILQNFITEKYKRFWYPTRPLFTLGFGLILTSLGFSGILSMSWALWLAAAFAFDDLPLTPIIRFATAMNNLILGRKKIKAITTLIVITLAIIMGGWIGFLLYSQNSFLVVLIADFISATGCSPILISLGAILGGMLAQFSDKMSHFNGIALGVFFMSLIPLQIPLMIDLVFITAAASAFFASIMTKQVLRLYTQFRYGHSNADGYDMDRSDMDQLFFIENQATKFNVSVAEFNKLIHFCRKKIQDIKQKATFWSELSGSRQVITNSYKDIYCGLMNPNCTPQDISSLKLLLSESKQGFLKRMAFSEDIGKRNEVVVMNSFFCKDPFQIRLFSHQAHIYPGLQDDYVEPFEKKEIHFSNHF